MRWVVLTSQINCKISTALIIGSGYTNGGLQFGGGVINELLYYVQDILCDGRDTKSLDQWIHREN